MDESKVEEFIKKLHDPSDDNVYYYSEQLALTNSPEVLERMLSLLDHNNDDVKYLAARTLSLMENNEDALIPLLEAINDKKNKNCSGGLTEALEGFDCSKKFVEIFKLYLFGSLKTSGLAKRMLDYEEFEITPRVIRKSEKHWNHFQNNVKKDEEFELTKIEVEEILENLKSMFLEE